MNRVIKITRSDYLGYAAESIVNSANDMLVLGSNTADRVRKAAGDELLASLSGIIASHNGNPLPLGTAVETPSFNAGARGLTRFIIHAVSLGSRKYAPPEGRLLATVTTVFNASLNALRLADTLRCRSIIYPVMVARYGYSVIDTDSSTLRWIMATALILGINSGWDSVTNVEEVTISVYNEDRQLIDHDYAMFSVLLRSPKWGQLAGERS